MDTLVATFICQTNTMHLQGTSAIEKKIKEQPNNKIVCGFIDLDKKIGPFFNEFEQIEKLNIIGDSYILLKKHPNNKHYLVMAHPAMDRVIFDLMQSIKNPPKDFEAFKRKSKRIDRNNAEIKNQLNSVLQKGDSPLSKVKEFVSELNLD
jgi:hypothetical protein